MNLVKKIIIAGCCAAIIASCKKEKPTVDNTISFKVDGTYKDLLPDATYFEDDGSLLIDAGPFNKGELSLFFSGDAEEKTYHLEDSTATAIAEYVDGSGKEFWSQSGTITVSSYDGKHIIGTFEFRGATNKGAPASVNITEGQFSSDVGYFFTSPDTCTMYDSTYDIGRHGKLIMHQLKVKHLALNKK